MRKPLDAMRIIHWASGAPLSSELPIRDPDPDPGLLGPDSLSWRLHEEQWLIMAGARAFLLQAAHPKVAQGALEHSGFAEDPFGRVYRTIQGMAILIFGTTSEANAMARQINRLHHSVQGTLPESLGRYTAGETYSGMEPLALLWVHIAFVDSILTAYKTFVGPLSEAECEQYWQESCRYARLLGLTDTILPTSYVAVQQYMREALASGEIAIGTAAHFIAQKVLHPPLPLLRKPFKTDPTWTPQAVTALDPSYPSAHGVISGDGATVLSAFFGNQNQIQLTSDVLPGVVRTFVSYNDISTEAGLSRIYAGQHTRIDIEVGSQLGQNVARFVLQRIGN